MPTYTYRARTLNGEAKQGTRDAEDAATLGRELREEGLLLVEAKAERGERKGFSLRLPFLAGMPLSERMMATRHLSVLLEAGVDLPKALGTISRQAQSEKFRSILTNLGRDIRRGDRFSIALQAYPQAFSELYVAMIAAGEESGKLVETLRILADQMEKQHRLQSRVRGAMMYPAVVMFAMVVIGIAMFVFVVPQLESVFGDLAVQLPIQTRLIFWLSHALFAQWYLFLSGAVGVLALVRFAWASDRGKSTRDAIFMRAPMIKQLVREISSAQMARTLSSLVSAGVPIVRALEITSRVVGSMQFRTSLQEAARMVEKGRPIHETLAQHPKVYPPLVVEMAAVGEESGKFSEVFADLAAFYEEEVEQRTQTLSTIIEPVLMIVIGVIVGFFVISMMQPMYSMIGTL
ncbi:MAG: type II secretion system F family protein [Candidatus Terrybacteria bacterium]|nr:type II secretion system F family protein [Candidatus Terrybacteria bacterium]